MVLTGAAAGKKFIDEISLDDLYDFYTYGQTTRHSKI